MRECLNSVLEKTTTFGQKEMDKRFHKLYHYCSFYGSGFCRSNVYFLLEEIKKLYPQIDLSDFKVLYLTTENRINRETQKAKFYVKDAREGRSKSDVKSHPITGWIYHFILEYNGRIYDLDYTNQISSIAKSTYIKNFFISDHSTVLNSKMLDTNAQFVSPEEILLFEVDGEKFVDNVLAGIDFADFHRYLENNNIRKQKLIEYMSGN